MGEDEHAQLSERAREFGREQTLRDDVLDHNRELFLSSLSS
jgi:hypothetical protein